MSGAVLETEEKKESDLERKPTATPLSPSMQRAQAAGSAGLSELSKQLRILQATNEAQSVEINRLERQLRILADLQGISVADLRKALEEACANEALGELQHRVAKLRAELEAATFAKHKEQSKESAAPHIANLELRIGELEELDDRRRREVQRIYDQLGHERARATRLVAESNQHKRDVDRLNTEIVRADQVISSLRGELSRHQLGESTNLEKVAETTSTDCSTHGSMVDVEHAHQEIFSKPRTSAAVNVDSEETRLKGENSSLSKNLREKEKELRSARTRHEIEKDRKNLVIRQLQDADADNMLRIAQFKARFKVQDERIDDMGQQLRSLYAAFGLIQEDQDAANLKCTALKISLNDADGELARQLENVQRGESNPDRSYWQQMGLGTDALGSHLPMVHDGIPRMIETPISDNSSISPSDAMPRAHLQRSTTPPIPTQTATAEISNLGPPQTPGTWELLLAEARTMRNDREGPGVSGMTVQGYLLIKSRSLVRKWKSKFCKLYVLGKHFQWDIEGKSFSLGMGISKVEFNPNQPLSFIVQCNPYDKEAPVICAAASIEADYHKWFDALSTATDLERYTNGTLASRTAEEQERVDLVEALQMSRSMT